MSAFLFLDLANFTVRQEVGIGAADRQAVLDGQLEVLRFSGARYRFERLVVVEPAEQLQERWEVV